MRGGVVDSGLALGVPHLFRNAPMTTTIALLAGLRDSVHCTRNRILRALAGSVSMRSIHIGRVGTCIVPDSRGIIHNNGLDTRVVLTTMSSARHPTVCVNSGRLPRSTRKFCRAIYGAANRFALRKCVRLGQKGNSVLHHSFSRGCGMMRPSTAISTALVGILCTKCSGPVDVSMPKIPDKRMRTDVTGNGKALRQINNNCITHPATVKGRTIVHIATAMSKHARIVNSCSCQMHRLPSPSPFVRCGSTGNGVGHCHNKDNLPGTILVGASNVVTTVSSKLLGVGFRMLNFRAAFFSGVNGTMPRISSNTDFSSQRGRVFHHLSHKGHFCVSQMHTGKPSNMRHSLPAALRIVIGWWQVAGCRLQVVGHGVVVTIKIAVLLKVLPA